MLTAALILLGAGIGWALVLLASPTRRCARCKGKRITRGRLRQRIVRCPRCSGTGRSCRRGATAVHRVTWAVLGERHSKESKP
ncbi:MAG: hypothetical protein ACLP52_08565 [Streptosporangiaceae bacterium]